MRWKYCYSPRHAECKDSLEAAKVASGVANELYFLHKTPTGALIYRSDRTVPSEHIILPEYHPMFNMDVIYTTSLKHARKIQNVESHNMLHDIYLSEVPADDV